MATRDQRLACVRKLLRSGRLSTQAELIRALRREGIAVDQSTLSRDLRELDARKSGGRYVLGGQRAEGPQPDHSAAVQRFTTCGPNLIVILTSVGQAQPVALVIEERDEGAITATLAGDDTVFVATKSRRSQAVALRRLRQWFGDRKYER